MERGLEKREKERTARNFRKKRINNTDDFSLRKTLLHNKGFMQGCLSDAQYSARERENLECIKGALMACQQLNLYFTLIY